MPVDTSLDNATKTHKFSSQAVGKHVGQHQADQKAVGPGPARHPLEEKTQIDHISLIFFSFKVPHKGRLLQIDDSFSPLEIYLFNLSLFSILVVL